MLALAVGNGNSTLNKLTIAAAQPTQVFERLRYALAHPDRPTAVNCYGQETVYAIEAAARAGLRLLGAVIICGFASAGATDPGPFRLALAEIPEHAVGKTAVALLAYPAGKSRSPCPRDSGVI